MHSSKAMGKNALTKRGDADRSHVLRKELTNRYSSKFLFLLSGSSLQIKGKVDPIHATKAYRGSGGTAPPILNFGDR
jgi:hypothetical protein